MEGRDEDEEVPTYQLYLPFGDVSVARTNFDLIIDATTRTRHAI